MPRPSHFEIHADDPSRAQSFYETVFGWSFEPWGDAYWLISTGEESPGIDGGMLPRQSATPADEAAVNSYVITMTVDDLDKTATSVTEAGGTVAVPKSAIPTMGWLAYYKDTEGNIFGLMQNDSSAA